MCKPCRSPPIQRSQCVYVWNRLPELPTEMAQNRGRHIFERSQCRAGHAQEAELKGGTDPVPRSESPAHGIRLESIDIPDRRAEPTAPSRPARETATSLG